MHWEEEFMPRRTHVVRAACIALAMSALCASARTATALDISGAGSTFVFPILSKWADAYKDKTGVSVNY